MRALITGASSGIGRDMAIYLASKGYDLVVVGRNTHKLEELKTIVSTNVEVVSMDLSIPNNAIKLHEIAHDIDILINNAGFGLFGEFANTSLDTELCMINTNIVAVHILTKLYLQDMIKKNSGYILNVASIAGFLPGPLMSTYYSSKAYVLRFSQSLQAELKKSKSKVNLSVLCPGPINTNFFDTAGVDFRTKFVSSKYIAKYAIDKMFKGKKVIVPTFVVKLARVSTKLIPDKILAKSIYYIQKKRNS